MKDNLEIELMDINEQLEQAKRIFNERLEGNPIGLVVFNQSMENLLCSDITPCDSAYRFYETYSALFDYGRDFKLKHPEDGKAVVNAKLERFCIEDDAIREYLTAHLYIPSSDSLQRFAHSVVDMYTTLVNLEFEEIIALEKAKKDKEDQLASLEGEESDTLLSPLDIPFDIIGDAARSLANKGARKLLKIATFVKDKTDKK